MARIRKDQQFAVIESYRSGSLTQRQFCLENNLNYHTFQFWLKQFRQEKGQNTERKKQPVASGFIPIEVPSMSPDSTPGGHSFLIEFPNGIKLSFATVPEFDFIRELLAIRAD